ncbi:MAG TPA: hypothetical protein VGB94_06665 [Acidobacteriaceae bacterium]
MARRKKHTPEQVVNLLRQIEVAWTKWKTTFVACKEDPLSRAGQSPLGFSQYKEAPQ